MTVNYSFDIFEINKVHDKYIILLSGWCFDKGKGIPTIVVKVNGKEHLLHCETISRADVCQSYNLQSNNFIKCGFRLKTDITDQLDSLSIEAKFTNITTDLFSENGKNLQKRIKNQLLSFNIEEVTKNDETNMFHVRGWILPFMNEEVKVDIVNEDEKIIISTIRYSPREDLSVFEEYDCKARGFNCSFHSNGNQNKYIRFVIGSNVYKDDINKYLSSKTLSFISLLKKINFKNIQKGIHSLLDIGLKDTIFRLNHSNDPKYVYQNWFDRHKVTKRELEKQRNHYFKYQPKISIIVPTFNTPEKFLKEMICSVLKQSYQNWELCIADASDNKATKKSIEGYVNKDSRIKVQWLNKNYGISGNTNKALDLTTGDYVALFDHDDLLEPDALFEIVKVLQEKNYDILYTDEDKLNNDTGFYIDPNFKPDWSPDLFHSHNYITHLFLVKTDIIKGIGGFRSEYDGAQDYDLMFRCIEKATSIHHIPKVLYHWRIHDSSTAGNPESKLYAYEAGRKAIQSHFERIGIPVKVTSLENPLWGLYHVEYLMKDEPLISIVIPNYEHEDILKTCIDSLFQINNYKNFEVIIVENNSKKQSTFTYYREVQRQYSNVKVVEWVGKEFNFSAINNFGVKHANGEYILLLNNDTEMIHPNSLRELVSNCMREEVGVVGAKLLYADDTIQHAGVVIGFDGYAGHVFTNLMSKYEYGYMMRAAISCNYSAVTAACLMTKKSIWETVGGLDEQFKVACNDIDYCLKVRDLNKLVVFDAFSLWHHYESKSRGYEDNPEKKQRYLSEVALWQKKWNQYLPNKDPYYNPNFDITKGPYILD